MIEIAKFAFPKILKTGDIIEPEPYCQKLNILGLSIFPEKFLSKDLNKLQKRVTFYLFVDGKTYLKLRLPLIPFYPYPLMDCLPLPWKGWPSFYDLRRPTTGKAISREYLSLLASEVACKLEIINNIERNDDGVETFDTTPFKISKNSELLVHLHSTDNSKKQ